VTSFVLLVALANADARYGGGTGEPNDPHLVYTAEHLNAIGAEPNDWDKHFRLTADIDLSDYSSDQAVIAPDANDATWMFDGTPFTGVFDGNDHTIRRLTITGGRYLGLFGQLGYPGTVRNLNLTWASISGTYGTAGILVGCNDCAMVSRCQSTGYVDNSGGSVGGLVGKNLGNVIWCRSSACVTSSYGVGGLIGANFGEIISSCRVGAVTGKTTSGSQFGGLAGFNKGPVRDSYSASLVSGCTLVGGLVGDNRASIDRCYSTGAVRRTCDGGNIAGLLGGITYNSRAGYGSVTDCLWDVESSGLAGMCGHAGPAGLR
jgi:hypothetical protein